MQWEDEGIFIRSQSEDPHNAIDPQLFVDPDGCLWMAFGSFLTGLRHPTRDKVHQFAWHESIEAPAQLKHGSYYYLFVN